MTTVTTTIILVKKETDPPMMFRIHFNIPNKIGNVPTESQCYTNLLGVVSSSRKKVFFSLEDVREILQIKKEEIDLTFVLEDILDGPTSTLLLRMVEFNTLLDHLEKKSHPKRLFDLYNYLLFIYIILPKTGKIREYFSKYEFFPFFFLKCVVHLYIFHKYAIILPKFDKIRDYCRNMNLFYS